MAATNGSRSVTWRQLLPTLIGLTASLLLGGLRLYSRLERVEWKIDQHLGDASVHPAGSAAAARLDRELAAEREARGRLEERLKALEDRGKR